MNLPATRKQALVEKGAFYFTGKTCKKGHESKRRTSNGVCEACRVESQEKNRQALAGYMRRYVQENKAKIRKYKADYRNKNRQKLYKKEKECRNKNPAKTAEYQRNYGIKYRKTNSGNINFWASNRRAELSRRSPAWLTDKDRKKIRKIYQKAKHLTKTLNTDFHVDHIIPLKGVLVSGLHVPENLRVIEASSNLKKSNGFEVAA